VGAPLSGFAAGAYDCRTHSGPHYRKSKLRSIRKACRPTNLIRLSTHKRTAAKSIRRSRWRWPRGRLEASSIGGSKSGGHAWSGGDGYAVPMAGSGGSKLVIFVAPASGKNWLAFMRRDTVCPREQTNREPR